jgi:hypothetical protein
MRESIEPTAGESLIPLADEALERLVPLARLGEALGALHHLGHLGRGILSRRAAKAQR